MNLAAVNGPMPRCTRRHSANERIEQSKSTNTEILQLNVLHGGSACIALIRPSVLAGLSKNYSAYFTSSVERKVIVTCWYVGYGNAGHVTL